MRYTVLVGKDQIVADFEAIGFPRALHAGGVGPGSQPR